jgi:hypothetical protein
MEFQSTNTWRSSTEFRVVCPLLFRSLATEESAVMRV